MILCSSLPLCQRSTQLVGDVSKVIPLNSSLNSNDDFFLGVYKFSRMSFLLLPLAGMQTKAKYSHFVIYSEVL